MHSWDYSCFWELITLKHVFKLISMAFGWTKIAYNSKYAEITITWCDAWTFKLKSVSVKRMEFGTKECYILGMLKVFKQLSKIRFACKVQNSNKQSHVWVNKNGAWLIFCYVSALSSHSFALHFLNMIWGRESGVHLRTDLRQTIYKILMFWTLFFLYVCTIQIVVVCKRSLSLYLCSLLLNFVAVI